MGGNSTIDTNFNMCTNNANNKIHNVDYDEMEAALHNPQEYLDRDKRPKSEIIEFFKGGFRHQHNTNMSLVN
jgi:hypothetical protein